MKIYFTKKLSDVHLTGFLSAVFLFYAAFDIYNDYKDEKEVFEKGIVTFGRIETIHCSNSSKTPNWVYLKMDTNLSAKYLEVNDEDCKNFIIGDFVKVKYLNESKPILRFKEYVKKASKASLYFSIFCLLTGIFFISCKHISMDYHREKRIYKKGKKHVP